MFDQILPLTAIDSVFWSCGPREVNASHFMAIGKDSAEITLPITNGGSLLVEAARLLLRTPISMSVSCQPAYRLRVVFDAH